jgi:PleD family two-component response regulator
MADCTGFFACAALQERQAGGFMLDDRTVQGPATVVLVVDLDVLQRMEEGAELRREGFHVVEAATVTEAITVLQSRAVDIVLSQLDLEDSETLTDWVYNRRPSTAIVWGHETE